MLSGDVGEPVNNEEADEAAQEDVEPRRTFPTPVLPSQSGVDDHCVDHIPPRS